MKFAVHSPEDVRNLARVIYAQERPFQCAIREGADRSLSQNALAFKWYAEIADQTGETTDEVHRFAKLTFGCPILCRDDPVFNGFFTLSIAPLSYERQKKAMKYLSVTSIMGVTQMSEFLKQFERHYRGEGLALTDTEAV